MSSNLPYRERLEALFADIERLAANPAAEIRAFQSQIEELRARLRQLETHFQTITNKAESQPPAPAAPILLPLEETKRRSSPLLYEKEFVGFSFSDGKMESLRHSLPADEYVNISVPLTMSGQAVGDMQIAVPSSRALTPEETELLNAVAQRAVQQIEALRLLSEAERARAEAELATRKFIHESWDAYLDAIHQSEHIGYAYDRSAVTPFIEKPADEGVVEAVKVMDEQVGEVFVKPDPARPLSKEDREMIAAVARQVAQQVENIRLLADAARARAEAEEATRRFTRENWDAYIAHRDRLGFVYDSNEVIPLGDAPLLQNLDFSKPLTVRGETIGHLAVAGGIQLTPEAVAMVDAISERVSAQLEILRLTAQTQQALLQTEKLYAASRELIAARTPQDVAHALVNNIDRTNLDRVLVALIERYDPIEVVVHALWDRAGKILPGNRFTEKQIPLLTTLMASRAPYIISDFDTATNVDDITRATFKYLGVKSAAILPIATAETLYGWLLLETTFTKREFSEKDLAPIMTLAGPAAVILQNARLFEQTQAALAETRRLARAVQSTSDVVVMTDLNGTIQFVNEAFTKVTGYTFEEAVGHQPSLLKSGQTSQAVYKELWATILSGQTWSGELINKRKDGSFYYAALTISPVLDEQGKPVQFVAIQRDITERKRAEETLRRQHAYLAALNRVMTAASSLDLQESLQAASREVVQILNARSCGITLLDPSRQNLNVVADYDAVTGRPEAVGVVIPLAGNASSIQVIETKRSVIVPQAQTSPLTTSIHELLRARQTECLMIVPLLVHGEVIGTIGVDADEPDRIFTPDEVALVETIAGQLARVIENARLFEHVQKRANELETVAKVSTAASTVLDASLLLQNVVDLTKNNFSLYHVHIYLLDEAEALLVLAAGAGEVGRRMASKERTIPLAWSKSLVARAARTRQAVIVNDVRAEPDFLPHPLLPNTRSEMAVPMIVGDKLLGVFDVQSDEPNHFTQQDATVYTTLAAQVAVALQNARLYQEQAATVTQLRELDRLKSSFLANMSHELRTPLNSILGFTDVILEGLDGPLTEDMQNDLQLIQKNGQHLLNLINDVLDMAKIEAGRMNLTPETFRFHEILEEVTSITFPLASEKSLSLFIESDSDREVEIYADRIRIRQVMLNLVNNAVKFTEKGKISLRTTRTEDGILVTVHDTGIGIPPDQLEAIFQEFTQVDSSPTRKAGGTGLGLPISRRLVEMHGGRLWAESSGIPGEGSTFYVELPLQARIEDIEKQEK